MLPMLLSKLYMYTDIEQRIYITIKLYHFTGYTRQCSGAAVEHKKKGDDSEEEVGSIHSQMS